MARINIEDSLFKDRRFLKLLTKLGCQYKTLGMVCSAWILAQENWLKYKCIPAKAWPSDLDILIEIELAERTLTGDVYVKGSSSAFAWLQQKSNAGKSKSVKKIQNLKRRVAETPNARSTDDERKSNGSEPLTLTLTPTHSHSHSLVRSSDNDKNDANANLTSIFELRMKFQDWEHFLKQKNIYDSRLGRGLDKISERFESVEKLESFVGEVILSPKTKTMNALELRKYIKGAIANETGLVKNT